MFETVDLPDCPALVTRDCRGLAVNVTENERRQLEALAIIRGICAQRLCKTRGNQKLSPSRRRNGLNNTVQK